MTDCDGSGDSWGPALAPGTPTFDHASEMFRTGVTTDNTLTIAGGNDRTAFYLSGSYSNQTGTFVGPQNSYKRYSFRLKGSHHVRENLTVGGNVAYSNTDGLFIQKGSNFSGVLLGAWRSPPEFDNRVYLDPTTGLHRSYRFPNPSASSFNLSRGYDNPFFTANVPGQQRDRRPRFRERERRVRASGMAAIQLHPGRGLLGRRSAAGAAADVLQYSSILWVRW